MKGDIKVSIIDSFMKVIIGLIGQRGSGKSTVAQHLCNTYGFKEYAFGSAVKQICQDLFCLTPDQLEDRTLKEAIDVRWGRSPRQMFQWLGTDIMRDQWSADFWVRRLRSRMELDRDEVDRIVISDIRFENEWQMVKDYAAEHGYKCWMIRMERGYIMDAHASESDQVGLVADITIQNRGSILDLHRDIDERFPEYGQSPPAVTSHLVSQGLEGDRDGRGTLVERGRIRYGLDVPGSNVHDDLSGILLHA